MPRVEAAIRGAGEVGFTVVSITLSLIAVFAPLLFFGGIVGRLFTEFALTLTVAVLISMVVSLTTTPMMCALHPAARVQTRARPPLSSDGARLRRDARLLSVDAAHRASPSRSRRAVAVRHGRAQLLHVPLSHDLRPVSGAGHGPHHRLDPGRSEHLLSGDEDQVHPIADHRAGRPGGRQRRRLHRRAGRPTPASSTSR